jgi:hypothetical protein
MAPYQFKPGQSGNPGGRPRRKPLTNMLIRFLEQIDPKDKQKRQFAQKLIREWYDRAMKKSDLLLIEILNRIEGKLASETDQESKSQPTKSWCWTCRGRPGQSRQICRS